jgi:hypothetical protein
MFYNESLINTANESMMDNTDQLSDQLLHEIMQLQHEIDKVLALNGNQEDYVVRQYRKFIQAKTNKLKKLNSGYRKISTLKN